MAVAATLPQSQREALINQYAPLVKYVVGRLAIGLPNVLDHEDVLSYGTVGLIEAVDRFDDSKGVKFETYAIARIRGAIIDALRVVDRLPRSVRRKARAIDAAISRLTLELGRTPTDFEVAEALEMPLAQYHKAQVDSGWVTVSLDGLLDRDQANDGSTMEVTIASPGAEDITMGIEHREVLAEMSEAVAALPERELLIVSLYYKDGMTMREVAQILDISESRVCQLHARALGRLRQQMQQRAA